MMNEDEKDWGGRKKRWERGRGILGMRRIDGKGERDRTEEEYNINKRTQVPTRIE